MKKTENLNLSENYKYLFRLLSSVLNNTEPPKPNEKIDWASVFYAAKLHSVVGMTSYAIDKLKKEDLPPAEILREFKEIQRSELILESNIQYEADKIFEELRKNHIRFVVLKGMVLKHYYPVPSMRTMSDVDILYDVNSKKQITEIFKEHGYNLTVDFNDELNFQKPPFHHFEMHPNLLTVFNKSYEYFLKIWDRIEENENNHFNLSLEDTYLYMLEHLAKHIENAGAGLRMVMDVFVFLKSEKQNLDIKKVNEGLNDLHLTDFAERIETLASNWFSSDDPDVTSSAARFILNSSTFGLTKNAILQKYIREENKTGKKSNGIKYILNKLFPGYFHICCRFPSAKKLGFLYPFYIPAYWFLRVFKDRNVNTSNFGDYFIKTDSQEAAVILDAMSDLGLSSRM